MADGTDGKKQLRSRHWYGGANKDAFMHRSWIKNQGHPDHMFDGRPVIGICNTWSDLNPCNAHFKELAEVVKRGVYEAGGFPVEFPAMSLGETTLRPTAMLFRNLASMEVEESIRANPIDGVVLLVGCDKTTPALLMGAASCDLPTIALSGGPMLNGKFRGCDVGSGTSVWQFSEAVKAGEMTLADFMSAESGMSRSPGHCMTMGTASTMASMVEIARHRPAGERRLSGGGFAAQAPGAPGRQPRGRDREGGSAHLQGADARSIPERGPHQRRDRRLDQRGGASARDRRAPQSQPHARRLGPVGQGSADHRRPHAVRPLPDGGFLLRRRSSRRHEGAGRAWPAQQGRHDDQRQDRLGQRQGRAEPQPGGHPPLEQSADLPWRHRGAARQPGAQRRDPEAVGGDAGADAASRPRGRVRGHQRLQEEDRRSQSRHRRDLRDGAEELRAEGLPRHGRGRQHGPAGQGAEEGHHRHGAHLRRAHERHRLRHRRAAHLAGSRGRRPAGAGEGRRHDRARCRRPEAAYRRQRRGAGQAPHAVESAQAADGKRLPEALRRPRAAGRQGRRPRFPGRQPRRRHPERIALGPTPASAANTKTSTSERNKDWRMDQWKARAT